jgi:peptide/nickel transport system permease protein
MNARLAGMIAARIGSALLTMVLVSIVVFALSGLLSSDVAEAILGQSATPEAVAGLRAAMHLDQPGWQRYLGWATGILSGDPGKSLVNGMSVAELIGPRLRNSLTLAGITVVISVPLALTVGILLAIKRGSFIDRAVSLTTIGIVSVPDFVIATLAVLLFAVTLHWLPALSMSRDFESFGAMARSFALPVLSLSLLVVAQMIRMTRAAVISAMTTSYAEAALLKGASPTRIVLRHALPNAVGPIANAVALSLSVLLGGVIVVEIIFNYPGVAKLMVDGVATRDMPLVQTMAMIFCGTYLFLITTADVIAILCNPRLRSR